MNKNLQLDALRNERNWIVEERTGGTISMTKAINGRAVHVSLIRQPGKKKYELRFPSYIFQSTISHFGPASDEVRLCRNKHLLFTLIKALKRSAAWPLIDNQNFLVINSANPRSNKAALKKQLEDIVNYEPNKKKDL